MCFSDEVIWVIAFPAAPVMYGPLTVSFSTASLQFANSLPAWSPKDNQCFQRRRAADTRCATKLLGYRIRVPTSWWITLVACHKQTKGTTMKVPRFISASLPHCFLFRIADPLLNNSITSHHCTGILGVIKMIKTTLMRLLTKQDRKHGIILPENLNQLNK